MAASGRTSGDNFKPHRKVVANDFLKGNSSDTCGTPCMHWLGALLVGAVHVVRGTQVKSRGLLRAWKRASHE